jgi:hypothetical protein
MTGTVRPGPLAGHPGGEPLVKVPEVNLELARRFSQR